MNRLQFEQYFKELQQVKLLKPAEEKSLWHDYKQAGDENARCRLIEAYQPLVFKQAMAYRNMDNIMDIVQEGTIGLIEAVENYQPERKVAFSLFAVHRIRGRMLNYLKKEGQVDIACMDAIPAGGGMTFKENLVDTAPTVVEQAEDNELIARLYKAMAMLPVKEKAVLEEMYMNCGDITEVADGLQVTPSHIYRLQKNGIRRIRGMLSRFMQHW